MSQLVLSLFPGIGLLDRGFEDEGFAVVRGPDLLWGGDVRKFHPPAGKFDGVIGGPPCQAFSTLRHLVIATGGTVKPNLIPEFERVIAEAAPSWFLMENVKDAPEPIVAGYIVRSLLLNNRWVPRGEGETIGPEQNRVRRFSFGTRDGRKLEPAVAVFEAPAVAGAILGPGGGSNRPHVALGGLGKKKRPRFSSLRPVPTVTANGTSWDAEKGRPRSFRSEAYYRYACQHQGLPEGFELPGFTVQEKIRAVGNGVPYPLARAIAKAVREAIR